MAQIGTVYKDSYKSGNEQVPIITLDIRTMTFRKKFTLSVNKFKYPDGKINGIIAAGKEDHPDYHIWANFSGRGESIPSVIVGNATNLISPNRVAYKRCKIFDPFVSKENIYFALFAVDKEKRIDENHIYNAVADPYRNTTTSNGSNHQQSAQPSYGGEEWENSKPASPAQSAKVPVKVETVPKEVDEDEIPF